MTIDSILNKSNYLLKQLVTVDLTNDYSESYDHSKQLSLETTYITLTSTINLSLTRLLVLNKSKLETLILIPEISAIMIALAILIVRNKIDIIDLSINLISISIELIFYNLTIVDLINILLILTDIIYIHVFRFKFI